jgi:hypothetical protein
MKKRDRASSLFWMGFAILFVVGALQQGLIKEGVPGPGFLPFICGVALIVLSLTVLISARTERQEEPDGEPEAFFPEKASRRRMGLALMALVAYAMCLPYLGFLPTTFLFMLFTLRLMERQNWMWVILLSLSIAILAHLLFAVLDVQLPQGIWSIVAGEE